MTARERPIPYSPQMVIARRAGLKTQTRRVVKWRDLAPGINLAFTGLGVRSYTPGTYTLESQSRVGWEGRSSPTRCPYGQPGDRLWVREAWRTEFRYDNLAPRDVPKSAQIWYEADGPAPARFGRYRHARFMCRWMSRGLDEIVAVRVERLHGICDADAIAEGIERSTSDHSGCAKHLVNGSIHCDRYARLWKQINGEDSWAGNPLVWVVEFKGAA